MRLLKPIVAGLAALGLASSVAISAEDAGTVWQGNATTFATAKSQVGEGDINGNSFVFVNLVKTFNNLGTRSGVSSPPWVPQFNDDGYPLSGTLSNEVDVSGFIPSNFVNGGTPMVLAWTGKGGGSNTFTGITLTVTADPNKVVTGCTVPCTKNGSMTTTGTNGYVQFTAAFTNPSADNSSRNFWTFGFITTASLYDGTMANLALYRKSDEAAYQANSLAVMPEYVTLINNLNPKTIRMGDWSQMNTANVTDWATRMPASYIAFKSSYFPGNVWAGGRGTSGAIRLSGFNFSCGETDQAGSTVTGQVLASPPAFFTPKAVGNDGSGHFLLTVGSTAISNFTTGQRIWFDGYTAAGIGNVAAGAWFITVVDPVGGTISLNDSTFVRGSVANIGNVSITTLTVGSRPAKLLLGTSYSTPKPSNWAANTFVTFSYDPIQDLFITTAFSPSGMELNKGGIRSPWPIEALVNIANATGRNIWLVSSVWEDMNSVKQRAAYISANLNSGLQYKIESINENWNTVFTQFSLSVRRGWALGITGTNWNDENSYYGLRSAQVADAAASGWLPRSSSQLSLNFMGWAGDPQQTVTQKLRLNGANLSPTNNQTLCLYLGGTFSGTCSGAPDYSMNGNRPIDKASAFGYASYWNGALVTQNGLASSTSSNNIGATEIGAMQAAVNNYNSGNLNAAYAWLDNDIRRGTANTIAGISLPISSATITTGTNNLVTGLATVSVSAGGTLPSPLTFDTLYYVVNRTTTTVQLANSQGGTPITMSGGSGTLTIGSPGFSTSLYVAGVTEGWKPPNPSAATNPGFEAILASYDAYRIANHIPLLRGELYEGGYQLMAPTIAQLGAYNLNISNDTNTTLSFNLNTSPTFNWPGHTLVNGSLVSCRSSGTMPRGIGLGTTYFVMNAASGTFDISLTYNTQLPPVAIRATSSGTGTIICTGAPYALNNIIEGWKNSSYSYQFALDMFNQFMNVPSAPGSLANHSVSPSWFALQGPSIWSAMPGDTFSKPYQSYYGIHNFNSH